MNRAGQKDVVILAAKRTPFGTFGGALKDLTATDLAVHAAKAAIAQAGVPADDYGHVVVGNVAQTSADAIYLSRHVGLRAGLPERVPALTVNRLCGSGFEAVIQAAMLIETRRGRGRARRRHGVDEPGAARRARRALGLPVREAAGDGGHALVGAHRQLRRACRWRSPRRSSRSSTGSRQDEVDEYAVVSQRRWAAAHEAGRFGRSSRPSR